MKQIKLQITKDKNSFKSHDDLILSIQDIIRNKKFKDMINDYYISKQSTNELWIFVFCEEAATSFVLSYMKENLDKNGIKINEPKNYENYCPSDAKPIVYDGYSPTEDDDMDFRRFLHDNTLICLDLHQTDLLSAKKKALLAKFITRPLGPLEAKLFLHEHFNENSEHYKKIISESREDKFWESFTKHYNRKTPWDHFYYNLILGPDPNPFYTYFYVNIRFWSNFLGIPFPDEEVLETLQQYKL